MSSVRRPRRGPSAGPRTTMAILVSLLVTLSVLPLAVASASGVPTGEPAETRDRSGALTTRGLRSYELKWPVVASGLAAPTQVTSAPDGTRRLFVVEKSGQVRVVRDGNVLARPYLSIGSRVDSAGYEKGLLSVAFSPSFTRDGLLWVAYSRASDGDLVVARMKARNATSSHVSSSTLTPVLRVEHSSQDNHFGGQLAFGPGDHLFVGVGDGGGYGDPLNHAQSRGSLLGKILRIDPYGRCGGRAYCVPAGNPFVGKPGRDEIWLMGLRNPWRFSFDTKTDDLWIGDVGQDRVEEIDRVRPTPQRINLGWSCWEGREKYVSSRCRARVDYLQPRAVVKHPVGGSVTGGFVYRGRRYAKQIGGAYVFADFMTDRVWLYRDGVGKIVQRARLSGGPTSFGVDDRGEIYAVTIDGVLHRMRVVRG